MTSVAHPLSLLYPYFAVCLHVCFKCSLLKLLKAQCMRNHCFYSAINLHFDLGSLSSKHTFFSCNVNVTKKHL